MTRISSKQGKEVIHRVLVQFRSSLQGLPRLDSPSESRLVDPWRDAGSQKEARQSSSDTIATRLLRFKNADDYSSVLSRMPRSQ